MAYDQIVKKAANNSYIAEVMMRSSTTGMGLTGLAYGDVTYGYWREGAATGANGTCVTMSKGTYADHGWVEVDSTNLPGVYQFGVPDAALATGANAATVILKATGAIDARLRIVLVDVDLRDSVRLGMTALPNAAADAAGGLPISDDGGLDLDAILEDTDNLQSNQGNWLTATGFATPTNITAGTITTVTNLTNAPTNGDLTATMKSSVTTAATAATPTAAAVTGAVGSVTGAVGSVTGSVGSVASYGTLVADVAAAVWAIATSTLTSAGTIGKLLVDKMAQLLGTIAAGTHTAQSGDAYGVVTNVTYGNSAIKTETALIYADTDELQKNQGNWATATGFATSTELAKVPKSDGTATWNSTALASINAEADTALSDYDAPTKTEMDSAFTQIKGATWSDETLVTIQTAADAASAPTVEEIDTQLSSTHGSGAWGGALGSGAVSYQWPEADDPIVDDDGNPLDGVAVWITSDEAGASMVAGPQYTIATGYVSNNWLLDAGTYYAWVQLAGYNASGDNPTEITVS